MKVEVCHRVDADDWHELLRRSEDGCIFQTCAWAQYLREYLGHDLYFLRCLTPTQETLAALLVTRQPPAATSLVGRPLGSVAMTGLKWLAPRYSWTSGPVFFSDSTVERTQAATLLLREVRRIVGRQRLAGATLPLLAGTDIHAVASDWLVSAPWGTFLVGLDGDQDILWSRLRPAARKAIRRARESGLVVETIEDDAGRAELHAFLRVVNARKGTRAFPLDNLQVRHRHLRAIDGEVIYVARHGGRIAGSLGTWRFNGAIHEFGAAQAPFATQEKLFAGDLLKWEIIQREAEAGGRVFDLCGVNPDPQTPKERGILQFKKKWGGEYIEYPVYHN